MTNIEKNTPQAHQDLATGGFIGSLCAETYYDTHESNN